MLFRLAVAVLAALSFACSAQAGTFYVSPSGSDSADGKTPATAWKTIARVNQATFEPGDHVLFQGGARFSDQTLMPASSGTDGHRIVFGSYGTGRALITNSQAAVWLPSGASWLRFTGLRLSSNYGDASAFASAAAGEGSTGIVISNCVVGSAGGSGVISPKHSDSKWTILNSTIADTGDSGIIALGSGFRITHNRILHTGWSKTITWGKQGIYAKGPGHDDRGQRDRRLHRRRHQLALRR